VEEKHWGNGWRRSKVLDSARGGEGRGGGRREPCYVVVKARPDGSRADMLNKSSGGINESQKKESQNGKRGGERQRKGKHSGEEALVRG